VPEEKAQLISVNGAFEAKPAPEVIKEALDLFIRYSGDHQQDDFQWLREITFADGERKEIGNEQDFFFHYGKPDIAALIQVHLPSKASLTFLYAKKLGYDITSVGVSLPSREHIDNILKLFSISEEHHSTQASNVHLPPSKGTMPQQDLVLSRTLVKNTRGYIESVVNQINGTYANAWYDACAVMIRRLIETLIIEVFEHHGIANKIKAPTGDFFYLSELISSTLSEEKWNLGRNAKKALPRLKSVGDRSAHDRRFNATHDDIDKIIDDLRVCVQELLSLAGLK
jgi:hypothetical protein